MSFKNLGSFSAQFKKILRRTYITYVRVFGGFLNHLPPYVRTFSLHKVLLCPYVTYKYVILIELEITLHCSTLGKLGTLCERCLSSLVDIDNFSMGHNPPFSSATIFSRFPKCLFWILEHVSHLLLGPNAVFS